MWGMAYVFDEKLYFTRDHTQGNFIRRNLKLPDPNQPLNLGQRHLQRHLQVVSMCNCSAWCMIAGRVSKPNICGLLMPRCLYEHGYESEVSCFKQLLVFTCLWERGWRLRCTHTVHSLTCVSAVVCVVRKPRPCLSYSRRRDLINSVLLCSYYKGGGVCWLHLWSGLKVVLFRVNYADNPTDPMSGLRFFPSLRQVMKETDARCVL